MTTHERSPAAGGRRAAVHEREAAVETRLRALGTALDGEPDPAFRTATRARLVAMAAVRPPAPPPRPFLSRLLKDHPSPHASQARRGPLKGGRSSTSPSWRPAPWRGRLTAALTGAALVVTAAAALVAVAAGARPGDLLYGVKRGTEQTQLALAGDARGDTLLGFAHIRLTEVRALLQGGAAAQTVVGTLHTMDQQTTEGAAWLTTRAVATRSTGPAADLASWTRGQSAGLAALEPQMPAPAARAAADSAALLDRIGARAAALTTALACPSGPATRGTDALGPVPAACPSTAPAAPGSGSTVTVPGGQPPATVPVPGAPVPTPPSGLPVPGLPGGGSGGPGGSGSVPTGGGGVLPLPLPLPLPGGGQTGTPTPPSLPLPTLPLPTQPLPTQPLPTLPGQLLPGAPTSGQGSGSTSSPTTGGGIGVCLPPIITVGNC